MLALDETVIPHLKHFSASSRFASHALALAERPLEEERLPRGVLIEISGPEARFRAAKLLAAHRHFHAAWVEESLDPFPRDIGSVRLNYEKVLFIQGGRDSSWAASCILESGEFPVLIYAAPYKSERELRRFRKQALRSQSTIILVRDTPSFSSLFGLQLTADQGRVEILRRRTR